MQFQKSVVILFVSTILQVQSQIADLQQQIAHAKDRLVRNHSYLNKPCNYDNYKDIMIQFWTDFFAEKTTREDVITFKFTYSKIYVDFGYSTTDVTQVMTWRSLHDPSDVHLVEEIVNRVDQRRDEQERCMIGGMMTCDETTSRCVCMDNQDWLQTELVRIDTGAKANKPPDGDPEWANRGCFIKMDTQCKYNTYGQSKTPFTCTGYNLCDEDLNLCVPPFQT